MLIDPNQLEFINNVKNKKCEKSFIELLNLYEPLINNMAYSFKLKFKNTPVEIDDIKNVMKFNFFKLIIDYDESFKKSFPAYIKEFLFYKTSSWIKHYISLNNQVMNYYEFDKTESLPSEETNFNYEYLNVENIKTLSVASHRNHKRAMHTF